MECIRVFYVNWCSREGARLPRPLLMARSSYKRAATEVARKGVRDGFHNLQNEINGFLSHNPQN